MSTIREQIIEAAVALLNTGRPSGIPACVRTLMQPNEQAQLPAITVFPFREEVNDKASGKWGPIVTRTLYLRFVAYASSSSSGGPADGAIDPIIAWISLLGGQQFGGLASDAIEHELNWQYDESDYQVAAVAMDFRIEYQTLRSDATKSQ